jgi:hypothetical protein
MATTAAHTDLDYRPSYVSAAIAAGLVMVLYVLTLSPETAMWDTSEYIAAAYTLGIPHPPGNPMFVLLGRVFTLLPIAPSIAMRVNLLAAVSSAVSAGMWFLITERVLVGWFPERWQRIVGGAIAVLIGATAFTVWSQSVVNEKVYTVSLAGLAIVSWLTVRWCDEPDGPKGDKTMVLIAYIIGVGYAVHMAGMLAMPAVGLAILIRRPKTILRWKLIAACVDSRRALPGDQRRRANRVPHRIEDELHDVERHVRRVHVQLQPRPVRQAGALRAPGAALRADRYVVALLQMAVGA